MKGHPRMPPYGSARDLPSVKEIEQQIAAFKKVMFFSRDKRRRLEQLENKHRHIIETVDTFYDLLGARNWVFTDDLNLDEIQKVVAGSDSQVAEKRLIEYYQKTGRISSLLRQLSRFDEMQKRLPLLQKALADYEAGRYYSTVLVILSMMDGSVNDQDTAQRRGLHARSPEDMMAWDSVVGHHLGLGHAHKSFVKAYFKTDETEITELARNGIMHGTLVNYDNVVVATKAWNRLFAVADWADARKRQKRPVEPAPSYRELMTRWCKIQSNKTKIEQWQPYEYDPNLPHEDPAEVAMVCADFLERWSKRQWAPMGEYFIKLVNPQRPPGQLAREARDLYEQFNLDEWKILRVRHEAAAVAYTDVQLIVNSRIYLADLRWIHVDGNEKTAMEWEPGRWVLSPYGPNKFLSIDD
ncbi:hypothetical protein [Propionibacterium ruminifibrarum]|nr:hypothetical protein [Propionibacterium ruminifibrarum]